MGTPWCVLTDLSADIDAVTVSDLYRLRWEEEVGFHVLTMMLTCELASVSQPQRALLLCCVAMPSFNIRQMVLAALFAEHPQEDVLEISHCQMSREVSKYTNGMLVAIDETQWDQLMPKTNPELAARMRRIARTVDWKKSRKTQRGPKKKKGKTKLDRRKNHVSTAKLLEETARERP